MIGPDDRPAHDGTLENHHAQKSAAEFRLLVERTVGAQLQVLRSNGDVDADALRDAVRIVCLAAHAQGMPPERVIIQLKELWEGLPRSRDLFRTGGTSELMGQLVRMALDEYFRQGASPA